MRAILKLMLCSFLTFPGLAKALVISDVIAINSEVGRAVVFDFDLRRGGYNPITDSITSVTMTFDVREIVEFDDYEDDSTLEGGEQYSMIFDRRSYFRDISTGTFTQGTQWYRTDTCQIGGYDDEPCEYSLDLFGTTAEIFIFYTDNIWFGQGILTVEVDRTTVPEPASALLIFLGLCGCAVRTFRT